MPSPKARKIVGCFQEQKDPTGSVLDCQL